MPTSDVRRIFVSVFRHFAPEHTNWKATAANAGTEPLLARYLQEYWAEDSFYDWGDDPSFFCATQVLGDARLASWGVCRPNIRRQLRPGDGIRLLLRPP